MNRTILVVLVVGLVAVAGCAAGPDVDPETDDSGDDEPENTAVEGELEIHHIDVGQADSTLVVTPSGETMLIDSGDWRQDGEQVIEYLEDRGVDRIDHLVATHSHADHIGGHAAIIEHFETDGNGVGAAYDSGVPSTSQTYDRYLDAIETHDVDLFEVREGDSLPFEDDALAARVVNPPAGESRSDAHYNSVSLVLEFGDTTYLTTGDAEGDAEERMVEEWAETLDVDAYQAGHHGSSTSTTEPFLEAVDPSIAVISSDYDSQYGHPHEETLERLADRDVETYWTPVHGDVVLRSDGESFAVEPDEEFSTAPLDLLDERPDGESRDHRLATGRPGPSVVTATG